MYERRINIQNLMNLTPKGQKKVDEFELVAEAERLYRSIKIVGLEKTQVCYEDEKGNMKTQYANELPEAKRAILDCHAVCKEIDDEYYIALCHSIGQGISTVHVETHALGLPFYETAENVLFEALEKPNISGIYKLCSGI